MESILDEILETKREEVAEAKRLIPREALEDSPLFGRERLSMARALAEAPTGVIAEFKRRSPSKGFIRAQADAAQVVGSYAANGASACSVLTDGPFFAGCADDLRDARRAVAIPLLRKDFVVDTYQLYQAAAWGADAVLLIAAALPREQCRELVAQARELGLEVLLEIHGEAELDYISPQVDLVGVNNRDLKTFVTDVRTSVRLAGMLPEGVVRVSESGIDSPAAVVRLKKAGYEGFLIGECFMRQADPGVALSGFLSDVG